MKEGEPVHGWISVHLLEGSLRAAARLEGHHFKRTTKTSKKEDVLTISFLCEEGASKCRYVVRIESEVLGDGEDGEDETRFRVKKVVGKHSCGASVGEPEKKLKTVLEAWVSRVRRARSAEADSLSRSHFAAQGHTRQSLPQH